MKFRICMIIARFHPYIGGTELQALRLSQALMAKGASVFVVTQRLKKLKKFEEINGLKIYRLFTFGKGIFASFVFMFSSFIFFLKKAKKYDIIHAHLASSHAITAVIAAKLFNKKVVLKLGGAGPTGDIGTGTASIIGKYKLKFIRNRVNAFIVPSSEIKDELIANHFPESKIYHIANGVNTDLFSPVNLEEKHMLRMQLRLPGKYLVVYAGRIEPGKGVGILLESWGSIVQRFPEAHLLILGEGSLKDGLIRELSNKSYKQQVYFLDNVQAVSKYLQASDIFVLPSLAEGLSNALLEAMSCGLAIITTKIGGIEDIIIDNENGILFAPDDIDSLSQKILFLFDNPERAANLGITARLTVERNYSLSEISQRYLQLYNRILCEN
ncbi:MAG: glycosyltransferase family 4 protein [bacterium]